MPKKRYCEIKIRCAKEVAETLCAFLIEHGATGAVEESDFPRRSGRVKDKEIIWIRGYFESETDFFKMRGALKRFLSALKSNFERFKSYRIVTNKLYDKNWREEYKRFFKSVKVSKRIVVKPGYETYEAAAGEKVIVIDPKMAFGIGNHPTTKMCIRYLDELLKTCTGSTEALSLLDAGTGSGIISIAAALLGLTDIYGFDTDEVACETALENIKVNGVTDSIRLGCHGMEGVSGEYGIVIANILANILISMKDGLIRATKEGGTLILSGILTTQKGELVDAFEASGELTLVSEKKLKEWVALKFLRG